MIVQPVEGREKRLLVADMDSTLIGEESVDELAAYAGIGAQVAAITERAMLGEIAFAPASFPAGLNNGIFVGFHGRFDLGGLANEENPLVFWNRATGQYFDFIGNNEPNIGHLDGLPEQEQFHLEESDWHSFQAGVACRNWCRKERWRGRHRQSNQRRYWVRGVELCCGQWAVDG